MDKQGFDIASTGRLVATIGNRKAFVPDSLPPAGLDLNALAMSIAQASQAIGELKGIGRSDSPHRRNLPRIGALEAR